METVKIEEYNDEWPHNYQVEKEKLRRL